jgi:hypothetical protein
MHKEDAAVFAFDSLKLNGSTECTLPGQTAVGTENTKNTKRTKQGTKKDKTFLLSGLSSRPSCSWPSCQAVGAAGRAGADSALI